MPPSWVRKGGKIYSLIIEKNIWKGNIKPIKTLIKPEKEKKIYILQFLNGRNFVLKDTIYFV